MIDSNEAHPLIPAYSDGELSEAQAGLLRKHLMDCQACRALVQEEKAFKRWFDAEEAPEIPADFAARVARRAFAGDTGERAPLEEPSAPLRSEPAEERQTPILRFSLQMTAAVAAVLMAISIGVGLLKQPHNDLHADPNVDISVPQVLEELEKLNEDQDEASTEEPEQDEDPK